MKVVKVLGGLYKLDFCISIDDLAWQSTHDCCDKVDVGDVKTTEQAKIACCVTLNYLNGKEKHIIYKFYVPTYGHTNNPAFYFCLRSDVEMYIKDNIQPKIDKLQDVWANHKEDIVVID